MTELLEKALESVRELPDEKQDALARLLMQFVGSEQSELELSPEEAASFDESLAQAERGEFATDEEVDAIWAKHGL
jgi:predicted transcriptional regulator